MTILADHLKETAAAVQKVAETVAALEAERNYYMSLCQRLAKLVPMESVNYADRTEIESLPPSWSPDEQAS